MNDSPAEAIGTPSATDAPLSISTDAMAQCGELSPEVSSLSTLVQPTQDLGLDSTADVSVAPTPQRTASVNSSELDDANPDEISPSLAISPRHCKGRQNKTALLAENRGARELTRCLKTKNNNK